ncbi:Thymidylate kinase [Mycoplasmopsis maculosa]|uniref:Thymidylate kinase n=1 Tax=Mycoplasmopsis maculosa TaxID=114885 RepID=A0A449B4T3_9BACT|nr:dTMP kinase [Mycoplasmopsis maculosa]VEU75579.1 Thymidylate kinase [Mycoplasmopsis maculosa]
MFITFEGPDGSGKTTLISELIQRLIKAKPSLKYILTREPGGRDIKEAENIRKIILDKESHLSPISEALLYTASRRIHIERVIWPALKENKLILCDRYVDSFYAYQGVARNLGLDFTKKLTELVIENTLPDLTIFLFITAEQSSHRRNISRIVTDRLDAESNEFHKRVINGYEELIKNDPERFIVADGWQSIEDLTNDVYEKLMKNEKFKKWFDNI